MLSQIVRTVNKVIKPLGIEVHRASAAERLHAVIDQHQQSYALTIKELHGALRDYHFHDLPETQGRLALMGQLMGTTPSEAIWILNELHRTLNLPGDVCEFGVAHGATSALLANEIRETDKLLWLFDSFEGLPKPTEKDQLIDDIMNLGSIEAYQGVFSYAADAVKGRLAAIQFPVSRIRIVPGFIEETIKADVLPSQVVFAYIDFDFYQPILTALNYMADHLVVGGSVVVDDYGFFSSGAQSAVDEFMAAHSSDFHMELPPDWAGRFAVIHRET